MNTGKFYETTSHRIDSNGANINSAGGGWGGTPFTDEFRKKVFDNFPKSVTCYISKRMLGWENKKYYVHQDKKYFDS